MVAEIIQSKGLTENVIDLNRVIDTSDRRVQVGNFFVSQKDYDRAIVLFDAAREVNPRDLNALCNGAFVLNKQKRHFEAELWIKRALEIDPDHAHALGVYAMIAQDANDNADRWHIARVLFEHSIRSNPKDVTTLLNYAYMLQVVGDFKAALEIYTRARDLNVMDFSSRFQRSMCMMTLAETREDWKQALDEYEIRHLLYQSGQSPTGRPMYTGGEETNGKSLLITCEQGIGDAVQMSRYVRHFKMSGRFSKIYMLCREPWEGILSHVARVDGVYSDPRQVPPHDYFVPSMSLMRVESYPMIVPASAPYLFGIGDPGFPPSDKMRIGLCWAGNPAHGNDKYRSIGPDVFCDPFAGVTGADFYSLHTPEVNRFKPDFVRDVNISSLERLAEVIKSMDLIVTVDTAILHIAGALSIKTFALLARNPDWRWGIDKTETEWYSSVKLFRASEPLEWKRPLQEVKATVERFIEENRS